MWTQGLNSWDCFLNWGNYINSNGNSLAGKAITTLSTGTKPLTGMQQRIKQSWLGSKRGFSCTSDRSCSQVCNQGCRCNRKTLQTNLFIYHYYRYSTTKSTIDIQTNSFEVKVTGPSYFVGLPSYSVEALCGIPTFTLIASLTYSMDNI